MIGICSAIVAALFLVLGHDGWGFSGSMQLAREVIVQTASQVNFKPLFVAEGVGEKYMSSNAHKRPSLGVEGALDNSVGVLVDTQNKVEFSICDEIDYGRAIWVNDLFFTVPAFVGDCSREQYFDFAIEVYVRDGACSAFLDRDRREIGNIIVSRPCFDRRHGATAFDFRYTSSVAQSQYEQSDGYQAEWQAKNPHYTNSGGPESHSTLRINVHPGQIIGAIGVLVGLALCGVAMYALYAREIVTAWFLSSCGVYLIGMGLLVINLMVAY